MKTLVVVDMQRTFDAANCEQTTEQVIKLVKKAKRRKQNIVVLEYRGHAPTHESIMGAIGKYQRSVVKRKSNDGGGTEVLDGLKELYGPEYVAEMEEFELCGVNFNACVSHTAYELKQDFGRAVVVHDKACNQAFYKDAPEDKDYSRLWQIKQFERRGIAVCV